MEAKDWSEGGQVYFTGGYAWGVSPKGRTICIGEEQEILNALRENKSTDNPIINNILTMEINNRGMTPEPIIRRHRTHRERVKHRR